MPLLETRVCFYKQLKKLPDTIWPLFKTLHMLQTFPTWGQASIVHLGSNNTSRLEEQYVAELADLLASMSWWWHTCCRTWSSRPDVNGMNIISSSHTWTLHEIQTSMVSLCCRLMAYLHSTGTKLVYRVLVLSIEQQPPRQRIGHITYRNDRNWRQWKIIQWGMKWIQNPTSCKRSLIRFSACLPCSWLPKLIVSNSFIIAERYSAHILAICWGERAFTCISGLSSVILETANNLICTTDQSYCSSSDAESGWKGELMSWGEYLEIL